MTVHDGTRGSIFSIEILSFESSNPDNPSRTAAINSSYCAISWSDASSGIRLSTSWTISLSVTDT